MGDGDSAAATGSEGELGAGVEGISVNTIIKGRRGEDFSVGIVDHFHHLLLAATTADEDAVMGHVNGHAGRFFARSNGPGVDHLVRFGVDDGDFAFVFEVVEDAARGGIECGEFGLAGERDGGDDFGGFGVDYGGGTAATLEGVNLPFSRGVQDDIPLLPAV